MNQHTIKINDLPLYEERILRISPSLVRHSLERYRNGDTSSVETSLIGLSTLTQSTRRGASIVIYTTYPLNEEDLDKFRSLIFQQKIAVPSLGSKNQTSYGSLDYEIYSQELKDENLFIPIFYMHTHPSESIIPSNNSNNIINGKSGDLSSIISIYNSDCSLNYKKFRIVNPAINVIAGTSLGTSPLDTSFLFYQLTENKVAFEKFVEEYSNITDRVLEKNKRKRKYIQYQHEIDYDFSKEMTKSSAFNVMYFPPRNASPEIKRKKSLYKTINDYSFIDKDNISKICRKFSYEIKIKRLN